MDTNGSITVSPSDAAAVADHLQLFVAFEWIAIVIFVAFLIGLAVLGLGAWKSIQEFRGRRIQPLINESKALVSEGAVLGKTLVDRGKRIATLAMETAGSLGVKAQTTANVVKGAVPEARRLPSEVSAATDDLRTAVQTAQTVRATLKTVRGIRAAAKVVETIRTLMRNAPSDRESTRTAGPVESPASAPPTGTVPAGTSEDRLEAVH